MESNVVIQDYGLRHQQVLVGGIRMDGVIRVVVDIDPAKPPTAILTVVCPHVNITPPEDAPPTRHAATHGTGRVPCCGKRVTALPKTHQITWDPDRVTCRGRTR